MGLLAAGTAEFLLFCMILMRMSGFILLNPVFGRNGIPAMFKTGFALVLTVLIFSFQKDLALQLSADLYPIQFGLILFKEFVIGYFLGFVLVLYDYVMTFAGGIADFQMGLSMATVYDAANGAQVALTGRVLQVYFMLLFFAVDGHMALIKIIITSSKVLPYGAAVIGQFQADVMVSLFVQCTVLAVKLAFPLIAIELLTAISVGMLMKITPQINLFVLNIELKVVVGILVLVFLISPIGAFLNNAITDMVWEVENVLKALSG